MPDLTDREKAAFLAGLAVSDFCGAARARLAKDWNFTDDFMREVTDQCSEAIEELTKRMARANG